MKGPPKGPWTHRVGVLLFTALGGILVFWLLGFVVDDIAELRGPQQVDIEKRFLEPALVKETTTLEAEITAISKAIEEEKARQTLLRDSATSSQQTMNQLLDMQKLNIEKNVKPSVAEQEAFARSVNLFLANQAQYQALNETIAKRSDEQRTLAERRAAVESRLGAQRERATKEFQRLDSRHRIRLAGLQLLFLIPLLAIAGYLVLKWRQTIYAPLIYAFGAAALAKVVIVLHEHFPSRYFKYLLLLASLAVVVRVLIYLIRATTSPQIAALLKQYREAYERFLCPICEFPIRRGPMRYSYWTRRTVRKLAPSSSPVETAEEPYVCPSCGCHLFEQCANCKTVRHSLLPFCDRCGLESPPEVLPA